MMHSQFVKRAATAAVCVGAGAAAGIAGSAAAPTRSARAQKSAVAPYAKLAAAGTTRPAPPGVMALKIGADSPVHAVQVVPDKAGDGFDTITEDSGTVKSVSGDALTITEGTAKATYATPTLTIPADATVDRNFATAKLADVQAGDHVDVSSDSDGTTSVLAMDADHWPPKRPVIAGCPKGAKLPPLPNVTAGPAGATSTSVTTAPASATSTSVTTAPATATSTSGSVGSPSGVSVASGARPMMGAASGAVVSAGGPVAGVVCSYKTP